MSSVRHRIGVVSISTISLTLVLASCASVLCAEQSREQEFAERELFIRNAMKEQRERNAEALRRVPRMKFKLSVTTLVPFADWDFYYVKGSSIKWYPNPGQSFQPVVVPTGFVTDLTSIPRPFWQLLRPEGRHAYAAVVHDYLYWTQTRPRVEADEIFKMALEDSKVDAWIIKTIYLAVRQFGQESWDDNERLRKAGDLRILKRFPTDFTTPWSEWKKQPGVFKTD